MCGCWLERVTVGGPQGHAGSNLADARWIRIARCLHGWGRVCKGDLKFGGDFGAGLGGAQNVVVSTCEAVACERRFDHVLGIGADGTEKGIDTSGGGAHHETVRSETLRRSVV